MQMLELHMTTIGELIKHPKHTMHIEPFGSRKLTQHTIARSIPSTNVDIGPFLSRSKQSNPNGSLQRGSAVR